jgi:hypothetical protein
VPQAARALVAPTAARLARAARRRRAGVESAGRGGAAYPAPSVTSPVSGAAARREQGTLVSLPRSPERRSPERRSPEFYSMQFCSVRWARGPPRPEHRAAGQGRGCPVFSRPRKGCPAAGSPAARAQLFRPAPSQPVVAGCPGTA